MSLWWTYRHPHTPVVFNARILAYYCNLQGVATNYKLCLLLSTILDLIEYVCHTGEDHVNPMIGTVLKSLVRFDSDVNAHWVCGVNVLLWRHYDDRHCRNWKSWTTRLPKWPRPMVSWWFKYRVSLLWVLHQKLSHSLLQVSSVNSTSFCQPDWQQFRRVGEDHVKNGHLTTNVRWI